MRIFVLILLTFCAAAWADEPPVEIKATRLADSVYMLQGQGGNMGLSVGPGGAVLIDDEFAPLSDKIKAAIAKVSQNPVRFLINTHWHGDHTGGNENFAKGGVVIVAQDNVRERMSSQQFIRAFNKKVPPSPPTALPIVTFNDTVTFHLNGDELHVFHVAHAHTDGDSIIYFRKHNVLHMGDTFFNQLYPFIDLSTGGSIDGMIAAVDRALPLTDSKTRIIPGHGPLGDRATLLKYRDMLKTVRDRIQAGIEAGKTLAQVQAEHPSAEWDAVWGQDFIKPDAFVAEIYASLKNSHSKIPQHG
ncbi:MAG: MBL fold metallo-hydrolase [Gammaproteobacteria bacterium]|nr:MBL fold metallo-hydrolase [Gammaproteobacteria bacterium]